MAFFMRFAIWTAVSRKEQAAPDKVSLSEQENKCRLAALGKGWDESSGPYTIPGASRSFYVNLSDAEADIPQLKQMLEDARNHQFDILIVYTYDRLGDLVDMIAQSLRFYGKQLYSVSQPVEPQQPDSYDPYASEAEEIMRDAARITQRFRVSDLRRKYRAGMPSRIARGLNPLRVPFGYRWVGKKEPPMLEPHQAALIIEMKDLLLSGRGMYEIARHADSSKIPPPNGGKKWDPSTCKYILSNPFYAGLVSLQKSISLRDPRRKNKHRQVAQPQAKWHQGKGKHKALWDEKTHHAILRELERRGDTNRNYAVRFPFSGLLVCSECGKKLHRQSHGTGLVGQGRRRVLSCAEGPAHIILEYEEGVTLVSNEIARQLSQAPVTPIMPSTQDDQTESLIGDLQRRRKQIQEDREAGLYTQAEAFEKITTLEDQIARLEQKQEEAKESSYIREEFKEIVGTRLDYFAEWVLDDDPQLVHRLLHALCEQIIVHPDRTLDIIWRTGP